jgi:hypothetical protein
MPATSRQPAITPTKNNGVLSAVNSFTFYQNQLPASPDVQKGVFDKFC